jgi:hypothetical protein
MDDDENADGDEIRQWDGANRPSSEHSQELEVIRLFDGLRDTEHD